MTKKLDVIKYKKNKLDILLILQAAALVVIGLIAIYDSSVITAFRDFGDKLYYFKNQLAWVSLGFFALLFFSFFDYRRLIKVAPAILTVSIFLLILVLIPFIGKEILGARRWINIGTFTFQPSELAKLAIIFYATYIMSKFHDYKLKFGDALLVYFLPILIATGLVLIQPDFGTALIFISISLVIYFIGGASFWHFALFLPAIILSSILTIIAQPYRLERLRAFLNPDYDPSGASYQINQIIIALSSGGLFGVGLGGSKAKFEFIPEVHNDAIFAVIVEETGFLGALILILLFLFLISHALKIAKNAHDNSGKILAAGITGFLSIQIFTNIASNVALIPLTGVPLPFISYGGSSLFVTLASVGILINIKRKS